MRISFSETQKNFVNLVEGEEFIVRKVTHIMTSTISVRSKLLTLFLFQLRRPVSVQLLQVQELGRGGMQLP